MKAKAVPAKSGLRRVRVSQHAGRSDHKERWAVSYADLLTILLVFFIAGSARVAATHVTPPAPPPTIEHARPLTEAMKRLKALGIEAKLTTEGLTIRLPDEVHFAPGDDHVSDGAAAALAPVVEILHDLPNRIRIAGYADATPVHGTRFSDNWELAALRGLNLLDVLSSRYEIAQTRLSVETFGAAAPRESNDTPEGRADNRRVEIIVLNN